MCVCAVRARVNRPGAELPGGAGAAAGHGAGEPHPRRGGDAGASVGAAGHGVVHPASEGGHRAQARAPDHCPSPPCTLCTCAVLPSRWVCVRASRSHPTVCVRVRACDVVPTPRPTRGCLCARSFVTCPLPRAPLFPQLCAALRHPGVPVGGVESLTGTVGAAAGAVRAFGAMLALPVLVTGLALWLQRRRRVVRVCV